MNSVSGSHVDDRLRNAHGEFRKASDTSFSYLYRVDTEIAEVNVVITKSFKVDVTPVTLNAFLPSNLLSCEDNLASNLASMLF